MSDKLDHILPWWTVRGNGLDKSNWRGPWRQRVITGYKLPSDKVRYIPATIILYSILTQMGKQWGKLIEGFNEDLNWMIAYKSVSEPSIKIWTCSFPTFFFPIVLFVFYVSIVWPYRKGFCNFIGKQYINIRLGWKTWTRPKSKERDWDSSIKCWH